MNLLTCIASAYFIAHICVLTCTPLPTTINDVIVEKRRRHGHGSHERSSRQTSNDSEPEEDLLFEGRYNCSNQCEYRQETKRIKLEMIKQDILRKLRLERPPEIEVPVDVADIPEVLAFIEEHGKQHDTPGDEVIYENLDVDESPEAVTDTVFNFAKIPNSTFAPDMENVVTFDLQPQIRNSILASAMLSVYIREPFEKETKHNTFIMVQDVNATHTTFAASLKLQLNSSSVGTWYTLDITDAVQKWIRRPAGSIYALKIEAFDQQGYALAVTHPIPPEGANLKPYIHMKVNDTQGTRGKRQVRGLICSEDSLETRCCRHPLMVDFDEFGWDWVIAPKRYQANYCAGECPFVFMQDSPHTHLVQQSKGEGASCCTATSYSGFSMLYFDEDQNIIHGNLKEMKVEKCGCS